MVKIDLRKQFKDLYRATAKIKTVTPGKGAFVSIEGKGAPGSEVYQEAIGALYAVAYTTKFTLRHAGILDFGVPCLECLYFDDPAHTSPADWRWQLMIRIPEEVQLNHIKAAKEKLKEKKGLDTSVVKHISYKEGDCLQTLHVGPYDQVGDTYERLHQHAAQNDLKIKDLCHEVYVNDPRRTARERLKTVVRVPIKK